MLKHFAVGAVMVAASVYAHAGLLYSSADLGPSYITLSSSNVSGGALFLGPANPNEQAIPDGGTLATTTSGTWLAAGPSSSNNTNPPFTSPGSAKLTFSGTDVTGVSFLWGSPDSYNSFEFVTGGPTGTTYSLDATQLQTAVNAVNGGIVLDSLPNQNRAYYVQLKATDGDYFTSLTFSSPGTNAVEISNVAVVPEPEAYMLALAALGVLGVAAKRRRSAKRA
ncbi:MAG: PEP-CTERM sorting domain-containing protein [Burkholderiales bacterium]|nr:PEP-CTERM sorting domain-containing protein [Burkholderiales bacterium]